MSRLGGMTYTQSGSTGMRSLTLAHLHFRDALQKFGHDALVVRVQMLHDDESHPAIFRHTAHELL